MFVLQVATRLLLIGECHDDSSTLRIQETTNHTHIKETTKSQKTNKNLDLGRIIILVEKKKIKIGMDE